MSIWNSDTGKHPVFYLTSLPLSHRSMFKMFFYMLAKELLLVTSVWPYPLFHLTQLKLLCLKSMIQNKIWSLTATPSNLHDFSFLPAICIKSLAQQLMESDSCRSDSLHLITGRYSFALEMDFQPTRDYVLKLYIQLVL